MGSRKRGREEMEAEEPPKIPSTLHRLQNTWEFACLAQYIFTFGRAVKVEDIDIENLEERCLAPNRSSRLAELGLALLKNVSSHKGLTPELFDEYTRRQYVAKAPERNPFGEEEEPNKFAEFDLFQQIRILHQLSVWTFVNPNQIRERMNERDADQVAWRIEPFGWDADDRTYFLLDDDRLYRRTDAPRAVPAPKKKAKKKAKSRPRGSRASKRLRLSEDHGTDADDVEEETTNGDNNKQVPAEEDTFGGMKWECIAITLDDYHQLIASLKKSKDPNEKDLHKRLTDAVLPVIEKREDERRRKEEKRIRDLEIMEKLALAKRSSRIAGRKEKQQEAEAAAEEERKRRAELELVRKEQEKQRKIEAERRSRMITREQRLKEREVKRILHEQELRRLEEESKRVEQEQSRVSERQLKAEMERQQKELESLQHEEWIFDCSVCGKHGENYDDGEHSIECEKCKVWQHSACHGINKEQAESDDFHFFCKDCKKREAEAKRAQTLKLKMKASPKTTKVKHPVDSPHGLTKDGRPKKKPGRPRKNPLPEAAPNGAAPAPPNGVPTGAPGPAAVTAAPQQKVKVEVNPTINQHRPATHPTRAPPHYAPVFSQTFGAPNRPTYFGPPQGYNLGGAAAQPNQTPRPAQSQQGPNGHSPFAAQNQSSPAAALAGNDLPRPPSAHSRYPPPQQPPQKQLAPHTPSQANGFHSNSSPAPVFPSQGSLQFPRPQGPVTNPIPVKHSSPALPPLHPHSSPTFPQRAPQFTGAPNGPSQSSPQQPPLSPVKRSPQLQPIGTPEQQQMGNKPGMSSPQASAINTSPLLPPTAGGMSPKKRTSPPHSFGSPPPGALNKPTGRASGLASFPAMLNGASWDRTNQPASAGAAAVKVSDDSKSGLPGILSSSPRGFSPIKHMPPVDSALEALSEAAGYHAAALRSPIKMKTKPSNEQRGASFPTRMDVDKAPDT